MNSRHEIVFKRCGCTDPISGRQLAARSPELAKSDHGSWYYAVQVATVGGPRARQRRGGHPTREAALTARQAVLDVIQQMLGHTSIITTADTYTSVLPEIAHHAAQATADMILNAAQPARRRPRRPNRAPYIDS